MLCVFEFDIRVATSPYGGEASVSRVSFSVDKYVGEGREEGRKDEGVEGLKIFLVHQDSSET